MTRPKSKRGMDGQLIADHHAFAHFAIDEREAVLVATDTSGARRRSVSVHVKPAELATFATQIIARAVELGIVFTFPNLQRADTPETVAAKAKAAYSAGQMLGDLLAGRRTP